MLSNELCKEIAIHFLIGNFDWEPHLSHPFKIATITIARQLFLRDLVAF
jgi:hypothetical protein